MECLKCGAELSADAKFCRKCGTKVMLNNKEDGHDSKPLAVGPECKECGDVLSAAAKFCRKCGTAADSAKKEAAAPVLPKLQKEPVNLPPKKPVKALPAVPAVSILKKRPWLKAVAAVLTVSLVGTLIWQSLPERGRSPQHSTPGYLNTEGIEGIVDIDRVAASYVPLAGITFTPQELALAGETAEVSPDSPKATISGVTVDFGEFNLAGTNSLEIARLPDKIDKGAGVHAQTYNITLGDVKEFPAMVEVTIPYDPAGLTADEAHYAISVGWYDESDGMWKILPSEVNTADNTVTFKTDHFTPFSALKNTLTKGDIVFYYENNTYLGPNTPVLVDTGALKKVLNNLSPDAFDKLIRDKAVPTNEFMSSGFGFINTLASGGDYVLAFNQFGGNFTPMVGTLQQAVGAKFTAIGAAAIAYKVTDQWSRGVTTDRIIRDNAFSLLELVATGVIMVKASPFVVVCAAGIWTAGIVDSMVREDEDDLSKYWNHLERSYDHFNRYHITYQSSTGQCGYRINMPGRSSALRSGERMLTAKSDWGAVVSNIYDKNKNYPRLIKPNVDKLVASYSDVFWNAPRADILYWIDQSGILPAGTMAKDLPWPTTAAEVQRYKDRCRARTHDRLQPLYKAMAEKELRDLWTEFYTSAFALADEFNETIIFEVKDPALEEPGFAKSRYAKNVLHLKANGNYSFEDFICAERHNDSDRIFSCNVYHYITAGMPSELSIYPPGADIYTLMDESVPFTAETPLTVIYLEGKPPIGQSVALKRSYEFNSLQKNRNTFIILGLESMGDIPIDKNGSFSVTTTYSYSPAPYEAGDFAYQDLSVNGTMTFSGNIDWSLESVPAISHEVGTFKLSGRAVAEFSGDGSDYFGEYYNTYESVEEFSGEGTIHIMPNEKILYIKMASGTAVEKGTKVKDYTYHNHADYVKPFEEDHTRNFISLWPKFYYTRGE